MLKCTINQVFISLFLALFILNTGLMSHLQAQVPDEIDDLDEFVERGLQDWDIPGMAVGIVHEGEVIHARGYGEKKLGEGDPVDEETLFGVASTTKAMTAAALGMMVDEGKLDWDDRVIEHLPDFQLYDPWVTRKVTVRDLLIHQVGIGRITGNRIQFMTNRDRDEILKFLRHQPFEEDFREEYVYSNMMYMVAGKVFKSVSGKRWDDFMMENFFPKLGMDHANTSITMIDDETNAAWPHQYIRGDVQTIPRRNFDNAGPSASVNASISDMMRWMKFQLGEPGVIDGERLISDETMRETRSAQRALSSGNPYEGEMNAYGLGWRLGSYRGYHTVSHGGATDGMNTTLMMVPEKDLGIIVVTNTFNTFREAVARYVIDSFTGLHDEDHDWHEHYLERYENQKAAAQQRRNEIEAQRVEGTRPSLSLNQFTGTYRDKVYDEVEVKLNQEGKLELHFWDDETLIADLEHWHYDTFRAHWRNPAQREKFVTFDLGSDGKPKTLNVEFTLRPVLLQVGIYPTNYYRIVEFEKRD